MGPPSLAGPPQKHFLFRKMFASGGGGGDVMFPKTNVPKIFRNTNFRPESPRKFHNSPIEQILNFTNFAISTCQGPLPASWVWLAICFKIQQKIFVQLQEFAFIFKKNIHSTSTNLFIFKKNIHIQHKYSFNFNKNIHSYST